MKSLTLIFFLVVLITNYILAFDLPEIIAEFRPEGGHNWGHSFSCLSDQNGDGIDDLYVLNETTHNGEVYYGGENMAEGFGFEFENSRDESEKVVSIGYIGQLNDDNSNYIAVQHFVINSSAYYLDFHAGGDQIQEDPIITISSIWETNGLAIGDLSNSRQVDFNNDRFEDLFATRLEGRLRRLHIFHGGVEFDTIPDWDVPYENPGRVMRNFGYSQGYDVNRDGFDDILVRSRMVNPNIDQEDYFFDLYLGGSPMDTVPALRMWEDDYPSFAPVDRSVQMNKGFCLLPDVNGDGFADWAICWRDHWEDRVETGVFVFFGGEELDGEPDLTLEGHRGLAPNVCDVTGGDFNGDGFGDIAYCYNVTDFLTGELHIHFGGEEMDENTDIFIDSHEAYNGRYEPLGFKIGAIGDYNGDGIDDFVTRSMSGAAKVVIMAGSEEWVSVQENDQIPQKYKLELTANPNPFNNRIRLEYSLPKKGRTRLVFYDVNGRELEELVNSYLPSGTGTILWDAPAPGVYLAVIKTESVVKTEKIVCIR